MCRLLILAACVLIASLACSGGDDGDGSVPILFVAEGGDGSGDVFSVDPGDGTIANLTDRAGHDFSPVWSPDGSKIAFLLMRGEAVRPAGDIYSADLYIMNSDGSGVELVTEIEMRPPDDRLVWNADADRLMFTEFDYQQHRPVIVSIDGARHEPAVGHAVLPAWMPDGNRIMFLGSSDDPPGMAYYAADLDTGERTELIPLAPRETGEGCDRLRIGWHSGWATLYGDSFSIDLAVKLNHATGQALYRRAVCTGGVLYDQVVRVDSSFENESVLTGDPSSKHGVRWSPDGERIAYMSQSEGAPSVWTMNADGSGLTLIADDAGQPVWSPDGERVAFVGTTNPGSYRRDEAAIFVANADGSDRRVLVEGMGWISGLEWSPVE